VGVIQFTAAAYARSMKALLPPGRLWRLDDGGFLALVLLAAGDELARVSGRAADLVEEDDPRTTTELITDYEAELDITPATGATLQERRDIVEALLIRRQRFRPVDVQAALAPYLGLNDADVEVIEHSRAHAITVGDDTEIYRFFVYRNPALAGSYDVAAAQSELDIVAHSHTKGHVIESISLLCDNAASLCDRDILGV